jgi:hypothetical protein
MNSGFLFLAEYIYIVSLNLIFLNMKRIAFLFFASLMLSTIVCQAQQYNTEMLKAKILKFSKMRNTGFTMIGSGTFITMGGIILISATDWNKTYNGTGSVNYQSNDPKGFAGILLTVVGVGLGGAGTALAIIGTNRSKKYSKLLYNVTMVPLIKSDQSGIMLTYRF